MGVAAVDLFDPRRLYRRGDRSTSAEAAESVADKVTELQQVVLEYARSVGRVGFTDVQLSQSLGCTGSTLRTRRKELVEQGLIIDTGRVTTHGGSNRRHTVWRIA
jgi:CRP-like cAMP-binding protein